jgi:hypothetical protein
VLQAGKTGTSKNFDLWYLILQDEEAESNRKSVAVQYHRQNFLYFAATIIYVRQQRLDLCLLQRHLQLQAGLLHVGLVSLFENLVCYQGEEAVALSREELDPQAHVHAQCPLIQEKACLLMATPQLDVHH